MRTLDVDELIEDAIDAAHDEETGQELEYFFNSEPVLATFEELQEATKKMVSILAPIAECRNEESLRAFEDEVTALAKSCASTITELERTPANIVFDTKIREIEKRYGEARKCHIGRMDFCCFCDEKKPNEG